MRGAPRYPIFQRCLVHPGNVSALQAWQCIAYNISATGIGVALPVRLQEGTVLTIQAWDLRGACLLQARIVYTRPVQFLWFTGFELLTRLSDSELEIWLSGPRDWLHDAR
jgi:hypothetical protein